MQVAEAVVRILEREGIEVAFGIPGAAINPTYKFLAQSSIRHYTARHEEGAAHAADGYFRASGQMAMAICTSGPAATNLVTGLYTAQIDSVPLIAVTGQSASSQFGKEAFQCVPIADIARPVCKAAFCVTEPKMVVTVFREAFRLAREGRPGPVLVDLPLDVQTSEIDFNPSQYRPMPISVPHAEIEEIDKAIDLILEAREPVLIMGGGVILSGATEAFLRFAEHLSLPIVTTYMAKGGVPEDHPLHVGHVGIQVGQPFANRFFLNTDLVVGIGCRFSDRHTGKLDVYRGNRKFVHIDIEPSQIGRVFEPDLGIVSDARLALELLLRRAKERGIARKPTEAVLRIPHERSAMRRKTDYDVFPIKPSRVYHEVNRVFPEKTLFYTACGLAQIWSGQFQRISRARTYFPSGGAGTLGFDIPAAIGGKLARPDHVSVAVLGDGGFMFMVEELAMAVQYGIPIVAVIINNGYLSLIRQNQKYAYGYEYGVKLWYSDDGDMTDFVKLAESMGAKGERVTRPEEISAALARAIEADCPYVVDVICERETDCSMGSAIDSVREFE